MAIFPFYTVHGISMQYITVNVMYSIKNNALLSFLTNDTYWRGALTINRYICQTNVCTEHDNKEKGESHPGTCSVLSGAPWN